MQGPFDLGSANGLTTDDRTITIKANETAKVVCKIISSHRAGHNHISHGLQPAPSAASKARAVDVVATGGVMMCEEGPSTDAPDSSLASSAL